jgi:pimeloyl-ACP methyl ester carboxylesterase
MLRKAILTIVAAGTVLAVSTSAVAQSDSAVPETGYLSVNGLEMYYEIHGTGEPLVLLHGGLSTIDSLFAQLLPELAKTRQVIAIEQQAHGHTADIDRPLTYENMVEDTAALLQELGITNADVFGFSMGGTTALGLAIKHPELVRKLVVGSAPYNNDGMNPENLMGMQNMSAEALAGSPLEAAYLQVAPNPENWPALLTKVGQLSRDFEGWSAEDIQAIKAPTLILMGDTDAVLLEHGVEMFKLLGGGLGGAFGILPNSQLAILPGTNHYSILYRTDLLLPIVNPFLDAPLPEAQ